MTKKEGLSTRDAARLLRRQRTPAEQALWHALRRQQVGGVQFRRQRPIGKFIADFYCHKARLVVEVDGGVHDTLSQASHDRARDELFELLGLQVLRVTNDEVLSSLDRVIARIETMCQSEPPSQPHASGSATQQCTEP